MELISTADCLVGCIISKEMSHYKTLTKLCCVQLIHLYNFFEIQIVLALSSSTFAPSCHFSPFCHFTILCPSLDNYVCVCRGKKGCYFLGDSSNQDIHTRLYGSSLHNTHHVKQFLVEAQVCLAVC